jgi:hypothetical protein
MGIRARIWRALVVAPAVVAVTYFAFWACAPALTSPEPVALGDARNGVSFGVSATSIVGMRPVDCVAAGEFTPSTACLGVDGAISYRRAFRSGTELGVVIGGGMTRIVAGGVLVRHYFVDTDRVRFGLGLQGGWLWAEAGLPMAFRVSENAWVWLMPSGGLRFHGLARLPVGVSVDVSPRTRVSFELAAEDIPTGNFASGLLPFLTVGGALTLRF